MRDNTEQPIPPLLHRKAKLLFAGLLFAVSAGGGLATFYIHIISMFGYAWEWLPMFLLFAILFFTFLLFAILVAMDNEYWGSEMKNFGNRMPSGTIFIGVFIVYVLLNFFSLPSHTYPATDDNGQFVLEKQYIENNKKHICIVKTLSKDEYVYERSRQVRAFSSGLLIFYCALSVSVFHYGKMLANYYEKDFKTSAKQKKE